MRCLDGALRRGFVLAFDTSNEVVALGLGRRDESGDVAYIDSRLIDANRASNQLLLATVDELCKSNDVERSCIEAIAVGRGPGSFTGVRIAIAAAKGLCFALDAAAFGISTLDIIAENVRLSGYRGDVHVVLDAMRSEIYPALYHIDDDCITRKSPDRVVAATAFFDSLPTTATLCGDALVKYADLAKDATILDKSLWHPKGESMISLMRSASEEDAARLLPIYTRLSDAEEAEREKLKDNTARNLVSGVQGDATCVEIRPCREDDASEIAELERSCFSTDRWSEPQFRDDFLLENRVWYKAVYGDDLLGYAGASISGDSADILKVCTCEGARRKHVATDLLTQIFDNLRNLSATKVYLEVRASNLAARSLYESLGFSQCGIRKNYFKEEDAISYELNLDDFSLDRHFDKEANIKAYIKAPLILAFESSCDETAGAVVDASGTILSSIVSSSASFHARFGGVVPEIASRKHVEVIYQVAQETLLSAGVDLCDIDAIAVTNRPGLVGSLVVGCAFAKAISWATDKPLIFVDHLEGHLYANKLADRPIKFPSVASLISGGNTMLVKVNDWGDYELLGGTIDDAVGEAYDKVAREFGLPYPGGPQISKLADSGDPSAIDLPRPLLHSHDLRMSLSGLKTAVILAIEECKHNRSGELEIQDMCDICASFEKSVSDVQVLKGRDACEVAQAKSFCFGGGVAANSNLRSEYEKMCDDLGIDFIVSPLEYCGDNAAMIGLAAHDAYVRGDFASISGDVCAKSILK